MSSTATLADGGRCQLIDRGAHCSVHQSVEGAFCNLRLEIVLDTRWIHPVHHEQWALGLSNYRLCNTAYKSPTYGAEPSVTYHDVLTAVLIRVDLEANSQRGRTSPPHLLP